MAVTWSTTDNQQLTLSNGNLTATATSGGFSAGRSNAYWVSGKVYFEITLIGSVSAASEYVGIATGSWNLYNLLGNGNPSNSVGISTSSPQVVYYNNAYASSADMIGIPVNNVIGVAVDFGNSLFWYASDQMRTDIGAGAWNNSLSSNPATGATGVSFATTTGPFFLAWNTDTTGNAVKLNATGPFHFTIPSGFSAADPIVQGPISATQGTQTLSGSGTVGIGGVLSATQAAQTLAASGTTSFPARTGAISATQAPQTLAATGSVTTGATVYGPLTATQDPQTLSASGTVTTVARIGVISATQAAQTLVGSGFVGVVASPNVIWMD